MDGMRVFACLRPPAAALDHLQHALDGVAPVPTDGGPPPLRWVPPEQRHVTLAFYGEVPEGALDELTDALAAVAARTPPLRVQLAGAGVFSGATLWMGVRAVDDERALLRLMADCEAAGEEISRMEPRDRRRAHLTVARLSARRQRDRADQRRRQGGRHADARAVRRAALPGSTSPASPTPCPSTGVRCGRHGRSSWCTPASAPAGAAARTTRCSSRCRWVSRSPQARRDVPAAPRPAGVAGWPHASEPSI